MIGVVGGGLAGLASACVLAARGHKVRLFERNSWLGGKAAVLAERGFRFDMGPTILTLPMVLERIFAEAGRELKVHLDLRRLDPQWRSFFDGGDTLDLVESTRDMAERLETRQAGGGRGYRAFIDYAARLHEISERFFFWRPVGGIADAIGFKNMLRPSMLSDLRALRLGRTVSGTIRGYVAEKNAAQMLDHFTQYVGSAPDASPAVLCSIASMQVREGVWYPIGGTRAVPVALEKLARELGVEFQPGTGIERIAVEGGRVTGVETASGEIVACDAVISNMDAVRTLDELVGGEPARRFRKRRGYEPACSGVVLYLGLNRAYGHVLHHNFVFSRDPHEEFESIYRKGEPAPDPTCYVCAPARTEKAVAPPGGEALYVLVHTPYLRPHHDWKAMLPGYRRTIIDKLKRTAGMTDIEDRIVVERVLTPQDIHDRYRVLNGAIYGIASHGALNGAFKPSNRSPDVKGLYLAGGAAHPGPGMPMVMMSGWIAADALDRDSKTRAA
ncbi:MAG: phytoene desaturase family protein [Rhodospirillales bacterium]